MPLLGIQRMTRIPYLKPAAISVCTAGILLMIAGDILSPSFVARYLSSDGVLERYTIDRILRYQLSALTFGFLVGLGSLWVYNRRWARVLCVPFTFWIEKLGYVPN